MFRSAWLVPLTGVMLLTSQLTFAQERDARPPSLGQRLDQFRKNLFGGGEEEVVEAPSKSNRKSGAMPARRGTAQRRGSDTQPSMRPEAESTPQDTPLAEGPARSSRRTFQPGYQPNVRPPVPPPDTDVAESMRAPTPKTNVPGPVSDIPEGMPSGYAGPKRASKPATPVDKAASEPTAQDASLTADEPVEQVASRMPPRAAKSSKAPKLPAGDDVDNSMTETSEPVSSATDVGVALPSGRRAPRTLEERLAAARSQQVADKSRSNMAARKSSTVSQEKRPEPAPVARLSKGKLAAEREQPLAQQSSDSATVSQDEQTTESAAMPEVAAASNVERPARKPQRVARLDKELPRVESGATESGAAVTETKATVKSEPLAESADSGDRVLFTKQSALLSVETSGPRKIKIGAPAPYVVSIQNSGEVAAQEVMVSVKVPEWTEVVAAEPDAGAARTVMVEGNPCLQWTIPALAANTAAKLNLSVVPHKSRPFDLAVQFTHTPEASQALVEVQEPKLLMTLAGPDEVYFGEREIYKLTLSNPGTGEAENVVVRLLPTSAGDEQAVSHPIGTIAAGESKVIELELTARQANSLEIKAEADADGGLHATIDEVIVVRKPELQVAVQGPKLQYAGTPATYRVKVVNPGNATAKSVQVAALIPRGASYLSSSDGGSVDADQRKVTWTVGNLRAGAEAVVAFKCLLNNPGPNSAQVACNAEGEIRTQGSATTEVEALADLVLEIVDPQGPIPVEQDVSYEVHIRNRGTKAAENVEVVAFFSPGIEPVAVDQGRAEIGAGQISFDPVATLNAGQEVVYRIKAKADRAGNHVFRAEVTCPTLETKLSADETTRYYVDDSIEPDAAAAQSDEPATLTEDFEEPTAIETPVDSAPTEGEPSDEVPADTDEPAVEANSEEGSEEPQPE